MTRLVCRTFAMVVLLAGSAAAQSVSGSISGTMPYFAGLKNVACSAIRKSTT